MAAGAKVGKLLNGLVPADADEFAAKYTLPELRSHLPLSNPKGVTFNCEICSRESHLQCSLCKQTYYCCLEHQKLDWHSVHCKLCPFIAALRGPAPVLSTQEERIGRTEQLVNTKRFVLQICKTESFRHLNDGNPEQAQSAGVQALRYAGDVFGRNALELVPPLLLLSEASIATESFGKAQELLCQAQWIVINHPNAEAQLRAQLARNFGRLYASQRQFDKALKSLSADVYYTATIKGADHIETSFGLFLMGTVFLEKTENASAAAIFDKVLGVWTPMLQSALAPFFKDGNEPALPPDWSENTARLAGQILKKIVQAQMDIHGQNHMSMAQAVMAHGLLAAVTGQWREAFRLLASATQIFEATAGSEHTLTRECHRYLQLAQKKKSAAIDDD